MRDSYDYKPWEAALRDIQGVDVDTGEDLVEESPDKVRSDLLDGIDTLSDEDKIKLGKSMEGFMYGAVQSFLWNAIVLAVIFLGLINFLGRN